MTTTADAMPTRALAGAAAGALRLIPSAQATVIFTTAILSRPSRHTLWRSFSSLHHRSRDSLAAKRPDPGGHGRSTTRHGGRLRSVAGQLRRGTWFLPLAPCAALTLMLAITLWQTRIVATAILACVLAAQPSRVAASLAWYRMPEYRPIVSGASRILKQTHVLRRLDTSFPMPPFGDATFPYVVMGGTFAADAPFDAVIDRTGNVQFRSTGQ
ncbi:MAG: hypothetical protein QM736_15510 [Vicinamibacterales bacterium]